MKYEKYESFIFEKSNQIAYVKLHRPQSLNAFDVQMAEELIDVFGKMDEDAEIRVAILTGSGEKAFCSGADLKNTKTHSVAMLADYMETHHGFFDAISNFGKPVIAAVNGYAVGAGFQMTLCCDMIIASENAVFFLPQVGLGILPAYGGGIRLARFVGKGRAMEIILTCKKVDAQEAYRIGLANQVVALPMLMPIAQSLAERLAAMPPLSVRLSKESLNRGYDIPLAHSSNADFYRFFALIDTEDRKEGHQAFREKRKAIFKGR